MTTIDARNDLRTAITAMKAWCDSALGSVETMDPGVGHTNTASRQPQLEAMAVTFSVQAAELLVTIAQCGADGDLDLGEAADIRVVIEESWREACFSYRTGRQFDLWEDTRRSAEAIKAERDL